MLTKENLSKKLKVALSEKRMTQADISKALNISAQKVSNYFRGASFPPIDTLVEIAKKLDVSLNWLCEMDTEKQTSYAKSPRDIAKAIVCVMESLPDQCEVKTISITEEQEVGVTENPDGRGFLPVYENVEITIPALIFRCGEFRTFLEDIMKMRSLLSDKVLDYGFYNRWLNDRIQNLSSTEQFFSFSALDDFPDDLLDSFDTDLLPSD